MKIEKEGINILDFCEIIQINLKIQYIARATKNSDLWCCFLEDVGIECSDGAWTSHFGLGDSPEEAINNFISISKGKNLVKSWGNSKKEKIIAIPKRLYYKNYT